MPLLLYIVLINVLVRIVASAVRKTREPKPQPLCAGCTFAHIQYAATGKIETFCTYGGVVRPMTLDVVYCTDYRDRNAPVRIVTVGFAPMLEELESMGEVAAASSVLSRQSP